MLSREENADLTRTGPGMPRLLNEDLLLCAVGCRDSNHTVGILDAHGLAGAAR